MRLAALVAAQVAALIAGSAPRQDAALHEGTPGPRRAIASLAGFVAVSRLDFGKQQNRLTAVYLFPDRVRWLFEAYGARRSEHQFFYRYGEVLHQLRSPPSEELVGEERDTVLLQMELRRAALLWPDGFEWTDAGTGTKSAPVYRDSCCREGPIGSLVATLDAEQRPKTLAAHAPDGELRESLGIQTWQELRGRRWPREMLLEQGGQPIRETIESVETRLHYIDLSFLPPDRRPLQPDLVQGSARIVSTDLIAVTYRERELPADLSWPAAVEQAREWIRAAREELRPAGIELDPIPTIELSREGRPTRCLLRMARPEASSPPGWTTIEERPGLVLALDELSDVEAAHLAPLFAAVPRGTRPGRPYLRVQERGEGRFQVALPLEPVD